MVFAFRIFGFLFLAAACLVSIPASYGMVNLFLTPSSPFRSGVSGYSQMVGLFLLLMPGLATIVAAVVLLCLAEVLKANRATARSLARLETMLKP